MLAYRQYLFLPDNRHTYLFYYLLKKKHYRNRYNIFLKYHFPYYIYFRIQQNKIRLGIKDDNLSLSSQIPLYNNRNAMTYRSH